MFQNLSLSRMFNSEVECDIRNLKKSFLLFFIEIGGANKILIVILELN